MSFSGIATSWILSIVVSVVSVVSWPENDCETVMVDNVSEVYLVSKVMPQLKSRLYHLPRAAWGTNQRVALIGGVYLDIKSDRDNPTAGDISADGLEVTFSHSKLIIFKISIF